MQYTDKVMNAFQNPKNVGEIENADGKGMICLLYTSDAADE